MGGINALLNFKNIDSEGGTPMTSHLKKAMAAKLTQQKRNDADSLFDQDKGANNDNLGGSRWQKVKLALSKKANQGRSGS
mmetsp:Transcript_13108/g.12953  ORF Transcript_13108/g.12953 Transcript_13108/m.12953 type:complete len:80 (-) Transcript_13108:37-276(-)